MGFLKWMLLPFPVYYGSKQMGRFLIDEECKMTFNQRAKQAGLTAEKYFITTKDE